MICQGCRKARCAGIHVGRELSETTRCIRSTKPGPLAAPQHTGSSTCSDSFASRRRCRGSTVQRQEVMRWEQHATENAVEGLRVNRCLLVMRDVSEVVGDSCDVLILLLFDSADQRERSWQDFGVHVIAGHLSEPYREQLGLGGCRELCSQTTDAHSLGGGAKRCHLQGSLRRVIFVSSALLFSGTAFRGIRVKTRSA